MKNSSKFYLVAAFLCSTGMMFAQPGSTSNDDEALGGMEGADNQAPIGDYLWVLAAVILVYTFLKFRAMQKNRLQG
jgi:hypothetical protein